ncbi:hypothetical protein CROQUDRAFT_109013 [Cronartium quercuum f. sp. fusiforme G11]|uniref:Uncharacterized protein n=1 Tax=Cronartium quercuum f. sp. fusiforme G11 TaxID=708437 RepID=A0A9P6T929_9BASI|nr:hypothetical protein CROQUDRAFT_109013 [Cronartium quercuum f. sp. fusiforme G11]
MESLTDILIKIIYQFFPSTRQLWSNNTSFSKTAAKVTPGFDLRIGQTSDSGPKTTQNIVLKGVAGNTDLDNIPTANHPFINPLGGRLTPVMFCNDMRSIERNVVVHGSKRKVFFFPKPKTEGSVSERPSYRGTLAYLSGHFFWPRQSFVAVPDNCPQRRPKYPWPDQETAP